MTVAVCIASRGRPDQLKATITSLIEGMELPDTVIALAIDTDDQPTMDIHDDLLLNPRVRLSCAEREDAIGAKYNRAYANVKSDVAILWADDMTMPEKGWDRKISEAAQLFGGEPGVLYFGKVEGVSFPGIAVTTKFVEEMGFFSVPYFYYWWHDTTIDEVARLSDRILHVNVSVKLLADLKGNSRNVQEITFWAEFFDKLRPRRLEVASSIIEKYSSPWRKVQLRQRVRGMEQWLNQRNSILRKPEEAARLEKFYSDGNAVQDDRYWRLKSAAQKMMDEMK